MKTKQTPTLNIQSTRVLKNTKNILNKFSKELHIDLINNGVDNDEPFPGFNNKVIRYFNENVVLASNLGILILLKKLDPNKKFSEEIDQALEQYIFKFPKYNIPVNMFEGNIYE